MLSPNNNSATLNVAEKLEKKGLSFLTAFLGSRANKDRFLEGQTGRYPDMAEWVLEPEEQAALDQEVTALSKELSEMLSAKNRIAAIEQELLELTPEQHYFANTMPPMDRRRWNRSRVFLARKFYPSGWSMSSMRSGRAGWDCCKNSPSCSASTAPR